MLFGRVCNYVRPRKILQAVLMNLNGWSKATGNGFFPAFFPFVI
jgi:hypothetical protein